MSLKIKTKVTLGILFVYLEFLIIGGLSIYYFSVMNYSTELMIKNNYQSVIYSENMVQALDEINLAVNSRYLNKLYHFDKNSLEVSYNKFEENLKKEEVNITEHGEKELAQSISQKYFKYKSLVLIQKTDSITDKANFYFVNIVPLLNELKGNIFSVSNLNMQSIIQKNDNLNQLVDRIYKNLSIALAFCFMITFSFTFNFPNYIAKPIKEITESIKEIAYKKFKSPIRFSSKDELNQLVEAFNYLEAKLEQNLQTQIVKGEIIPKVELLDENLILQNIQSLLGSIGVLMDSLSQTENSELIHKQSKNIQRVEQELKKLLNE
jgi:methyl-accepting chemotaxis protein